MRLFSANISHLSIICPVGATQVGKGGREGRLRTVRGRREGRLARDATLYLFFRLGGQTPRQGYIILLFPESVNLSVSHFKPSSAALLPSFCFAQLSRWMFSREEATDNVIIIFLDKDTILEIKNNS